MIRALPGRELTALACGQEVNFVNDFFDFCVRVVFNDGQRDAVDDRASFTELI